ncbi:MAG TPA: four helix bundle protein [Bacteroidia bacterium]|nr:four helix bundle protein [Bacteroidia bacterium]
MKNQKYEKSEELKLRTKQFALRIIKMYQSLPKTEESRIIGRQLLRSGISIGANYRAVCRARSEAEFFSKLSIVVEEGDECVFWLELLSEAAIVKSDKMTLILKEANEILAIMASSRKTAKLTSKSVNQKISK